MGVEVKVRRAILPEWHHALNKLTYPVPTILLSLLIFFWVSILTNISDLKLIAIIVSIFSLIRLTLFIQLVTADLEEVKI